MELPLRLKCFFLPPSKHMWVPSPRSEHTPQQQPNHCNDSPGSLTCHATRELQGCCVFDLLNLTFCVYFCSNCIFCIMKALNVHVPKKKNSSSFVFAIQNPSSHPKALQWGDIGTWVSPILYKGKDERFWRLMSILAESGASVIQKGTRLYSAECLTRTNLHLEVNEKNVCLESNLIITFQPMSIYCCHPDTHLLSF